MDYHDNLHFVWVTHRTDGGCLLQSVRSVLALGVAPARCWVGQQVGRELEPGHAARLRAAGVTVFDSRYARTESYADHLSRIRAILHPADDGVEGWTYNIDSDTVLSSLHPALRVMETDAVVAAAAAWEGVPFAGCACLLRWDAARAVHADLRDHNTLAFPGGPGLVGDDTAHGLLLRHLYGPERVVAWPIGTYLRRYRYARDPDTLAGLALRRPPAIHFGERVDARPLALGRPVRDVVEDAMRGYLDLLAAPLL